MLFVVCFTNYLFVNNLVHTPLIYYITVSAVVFYWSLFVYFITVSAVVFYWSLLVYYITLSAMVFYWFNLVHIKFGCHC